jgi:hypothetical protein
LVTGGAVFWGLRRQQPSPSTPVLETQVPESPASAPTPPPIQADASLPVESSPPEAQLPAEQPSVRVPSPPPAPKKAKETGHQSEQQTLRPSVTVETSAAPIPILGYLRIKRSPANSQVTVQSSGDSQPKVVGEDHLDLQEGAYTLTATANGFKPVSVTVQVETGRTDIIDLTLQPLPEPAKDFKAAWEKTGEWSTEGDWRVHQGGNFVLSALQPITGVYTFTLWRRSKNVQWVVNYRDERNYDLFEIDKKSFFRYLVRNGKKTQAIKVAHGVEKEPFYNLQMVIMPESISHRIHNGKEWVTLEDWKGAGPVGGRFGFYVPGKDQIGLSHFMYKSR